MNGTKRWIGFSCITPLLLALLLTGTTATATELGFSGLARFTVSDDPAVEVRGVGNFGTFAGPQQGMAMYYVNYTAFGASGDEYRRAQVGMDNIVLKLDLGYDFGQDTFPISFRGDAAWEGEVAPRAPFSRYGGIVTYGAFAGGSGTKIFADDGQGGLTRTPIPNPGSLPFDSAIAMHGRHGVYAVQDAVDKTLTVGEFDLGSLGGITFGVHYTFPDIRGAYNGGLRTAIDIDSDANWCIPAQHTGDRIVMLYCKRDGVILDFNIGTLDEPDGQTPADLNKVAVKSAFGRWVAAYVDHTGTIRLSMSDPDSDEGPILLDAGKTRLNGVSGNTTEIDIIDAQWNGFWLAYKDRFSLTAKFDYYSGLTLRREFSVDAGPMDDGPLDIAMGPWGGIGGFFNSDGRLTGATFTPDPAPATTFAANLYLNTAIEFNSKYWLVESRLEAITDKDVIWSVVRISGLPDDKPVDEPARLVPAGSTLWLETKLTIVDEMRFFVSNDSFFMTLEEDQESPWRLGLKWSF